MLGCFKSRRGVAAAVAVAILGMLGSAGAGHAQTCGSDYAIKDGETLADIAARVCGSRGQWTVIFYSNQNRLGENASLLVPGLEVRLP